MTLMERALLALQAIPGATAHEIAAELEMDFSRRLSDTLRELQRKGVARCEGWSRHARWWATGTPLVDGRRKGDEGRPKVVRLKRSPPKVRPRHILDICWQNGR